MSNYDWTKPRIRKRNLFIVEGNHEKNIFIKLILQSYPEMEIDWNDVIIYGTNIYSLYDTIVETYGRNWNDIDVDLTYIVREKTDSNESWTYDDFINIILIFDYERHDPCFSEEKITKMQSYFQDSAYVGKLYLNYPMLESYQHFFCIPDLGYCDRRVSVSLQPGRKYKNIVKSTFIARLVNLPEKMTQILGQRFGLSDQNKCTECVEKMLRINAAEIDLEKQIEQILVCVLDKKDLLTAKYQFRDLIMKNKYADYGMNYFQYVRNVFDAIIIHNMRKANRIQQGEYDVPIHKMKECYDAIKEIDILYEQNNMSRDIQNGIIWVLNTSVFIIPDYNYNMLSGREFCVTNV